MYNDPAGGSQSSVGDTQFNEFYWQKKALIEAKKEAYFGQLADVTSMPKHFGKKIKKYHYLPLLDDANINDQGIDADGVGVGVDKQTVTIKVAGPRIGAQLDGSSNLYFVGEGNDAAAALLAAQTLVNAWINRSIASGGLGSVLTTQNSEAADYAEYTATGGSYASGSSPFDDGYTFTGDTVGDAVPATGNLYGSSKDVGTISGKLPALSEVGGRVNRVGFRRVELEGSIEKFGFFDEYTQESLDFDTDAELSMHINREMINGANEMTEDALQIDLLNGAGVVRYGGVAIQTSEVTGEANGTASVPTYEDLMRLSIDLDNNRCPKATKLITGTRMVDTQTVNGARYMFIGSELIPMVKKMKSMDPSAEVGSGFVSVEKYAAAGNIARGEIGQIDQFKIIVVPEMMHWAGVGATVGGDGGNTAGYRESGGKYDVFPMLVVGEQSFTTIGFQTDGKTVKFKIKHSKPGDAISYSKDDPYGEMGFMSIKWYYGTMLLRPERLAVVKCVAEY